MPHTNPSNTSVLQTNASFVEQQELSTAEVICFATLFSCLVLIAVIGNAVVCILLRLRYMQCTRYLVMSCTRRLVRQSTPADLWADELPSSQHECSCGKSFQLGPSNSGRYVIFTTKRPRLEPGNFKPTYDNLKMVRKEDKVAAQFTQTKRVQRQWHRIDRLRPPKQSGITSLFLFNLSLADFLMAVLCIPTYIVTEIIYLYWPFGEPMCKMVSYAQGVSVFVSALTHVLIAWDRFILVYYPLRPRISYSTAVTLLLSVWMLAGIIPLPIPIVNHIEKFQKKWQCVEDWSKLFPDLVSMNNSQSNGEYHFSLFNVTFSVELSSAYTVVLMILQYFLPLGVICGTYTAIAIRVQRMQTPGERDLVRDQNQMRARRKMIKMLTTVAVMYGLSQLPRHMLYLHGSIHREFWTYPHSVRLWAAATFARDSSTCYNPFIYAWVNRNFRKDVYNLFCSRCRQAVTSLEQSQLQKSRIVHESPLAQMEQSRMTYNGFS